MCGRDRVRVVAKLYCKVFSEARAYPLGIKIIFSLTDLPLFRIIKLDDYE